MFAVEQVGIVNQPQLFPQRIGQQHQRMPAAYEPRSSFREPQAATVKATQSSRDRTPYRRCTQKRRRLSDKRNPQCRRRNVVTGKATLDDQRTDFRARGQIDAMSIVGERQLFVDGRKRFERRCAGSSVSGRR